MSGNTDSIYFLVLLGIAGTLVLCGVIILFYLRYQKKFYLQREQLKDTELEYRVRLLHSNIQSQEEERKRIGRDLHDEVGGSLANLRVMISKIATDDAPAPLRKMVHNCQVFSDNVMNTVRDISHNLTPAGLDLFGLTEVLHDLCNRTANASGMAITFESNEAYLPGTLDINVPLALYRVVQELLTNTLKHAGASAVSITITGTEDHLRLDYEDDGKGLTTTAPGKKGMGMYNIESRLDMIHARSTPGKKENSGYSIQIEVPLNREQNKL